MRRRSIVVAMGCFMLYCCKDVCCKPGVLGVLSAIGILLLSYGVGFPITLGIVYAARGCIRDCIKDIASLNVLTMLLLSFTICAGAGISRCLCWKGTGDDGCGEPYFVGLYRKYREEHPRTTSTHTEMV